MKYLVALGFLGMASAFQPTDGNIQSAVTSCITANSAGDCCRAEDGTFTDAGGVYPCTSGVHIRDWDTSQVTSMSMLFYNKGTFDQDISGWNVSGVTTFYMMFRNAGAFDQDLSCWQVSSGDVTQMFRSSGLTQPLCWTVAEGTSMFSGCSGSLNEDPNCSPDCGGAGGDACAAAATPAEYIDAQCCDCA